MSRPVDETRNPWRCPQTSAPGGSTQPAPGPPRPSFCLLWVASQVWGDGTQLLLSWPAPVTWGLSLPIAGKAGLRRRRHLRASRPRHVHSLGDLYLQAMSQKQILSPAAQSRRWLVPGAGALSALPACPGATIVPAQRPRVPPDSDLSELGKPHACQPSAPRHG